MVVIVDLDVKRALSYFNVNIDNIKVNAINIRLDHDATILFYDAL
jgi:hypothetical protein